MPRRTCWEPQRRSCASAPADHELVHHPAARRWNRCSIDSRTKRSFILASSAALAATVDLGSKAAASAAGFTTYRNPDLSLGLISLSSASIPVVIVSLAAVATVGHGICLWWQNRLRTVAPSLLIGGTVANLIDRVGDGSVTDWLPLGPIVLNVADVEIWLGLAIYLTVVVRNGPMPKEAGAGAARTVSDLDATPVLLSTIREGEP